MFLMTSVPFPSSVLFSSDLGELSNLRERLMAAYLVAIARVDDWSEDFQKYADHAAI